MFDINQTPPQYVHKSLCYSFYFFLLLWCLIQLYLTHVNFVNMLKKFTTSILEQFKSTLQELSKLNCFSSTPSNVAGLPDSFSCSPLQEDLVTVQPGACSALKSDYFIPCDYCGESYHERKLCPAKHVLCGFCYKPGHAQSVCRRKLRSKNNQQHVVSHANAQHKSPAPPSLLKSIVPVALNDSIKVNALVDTGSSNTYIDLEVAKKIGFPLIPNQSSITLASSDSVVRSNYVAHIDKLSIQGFDYERVKVATLKGLCSDMIIGHDLMSNHKNLVVSFEGKRDDLRIDRNYSGEICSVAAANIEPPPLFSHLSDNCQPIACKSRRYSNEDQVFIEEQVADLLSEGIIEPCRSPWRAQVLVTKDDRHKKRMVIDYSRTINKFSYLDAFPLPRIDDMAFEVSRAKYYSTFDLKSAYHQIPILDHEKEFTAFEANGNLFQFKRIPFGVTNGVSAFQRVITELIQKCKLSQTWAFLDNVTVGGATQEEHDKNVTQFMDMVSRYNLTLNHDKTISSVTEISMLGYSISHLNVRPDPDRMKPLLNLPVPTDGKTLKRTLGLFSYYSQWINKFSDKIKPLTGEVSFPLSAESVSAFDMIKRDIAAASLSCPNSSDVLVVETDASDVALSGALHQNGRPIAFFSRTLQPHERKHPAIEKEAAAIVESCRRWRHYLCCRKFRLITDQQAVSFIFDNGRHGKTKNDKIERWRVEMSCFDFDIKFRPGALNVSADCLSRVVCSTTSDSSATTLKELHEGLVHPGVARMFAFIRSRNLPYSMEDVKSMTARCRTCAEVKPRFLRPKNPPLIKALKPFDRLSIDFKGPIPSSSQNKYMLTIIDEYSRFPFANACRDMTSATIIKNLGHLFSVYGLPGYIHSDNGPSLISKELNDYLLSLGVPCSNSSVYNPRGNGQVERYNGIIWKGIQLKLHSQNLPIENWESALPSVLHSIRTLISTSTNETPHERFFGFQRRTVTGSSLPPWVHVNGKALVKKHVRSSKYDPWVEECEIIHATPSYAQIKTLNGKEQTVSLRDLAPLPDTDGNVSDSVQDFPSPDHQPLSTPPQQTVPSPVLPPQLTHQNQHPPPNQETFNPLPPQSILYPHNPLPPQPVSNQPVLPEQPLRRSTRHSVPIERLNYEKLGGN